MVVIDKISKEDKQFSKDNNISLAKAHYILELAKERDVKAEDYINKSIREIKETKDTGNTCEEGYTLERDFCLKEISKEPATKGNIYPDGYYEYKGKCYEEDRIIDTDNYLCRAGRLEKDKCIEERIENAIPSKYICSIGEAKTRGELGLSNKNDRDYNDVVCVDISNATHPVSPCELNDGTEHTTYGGKCYWHRAGVLSNGCPGKDIQIGGWCWDDASNILICKGARDGKRYNSRSEYCEGSIKYGTPSISEYKCEGNAELNGNKCITKESYDAERERTCKEGFTLVDNQMCINENNIKEYIEGYRCDKENTRLEDNICVVLDIKEANRVE